MDPRPARARTPRPRRGLTKPGMATGTRTEQARLAEDGRAWRRWGPYLVRARLGHRARGLQRRAATRGTTFPHDHARSRAYRWSEDGLGGICDDQQRLCFAFAFWNGSDPILKERIFGLDRAAGQPRRGRQGVLVVPRLDADPLVDALGLPLPAGARSRTTSSSPRTAGGALDPEFELLDTGVLRRRPLLGHRRRLRQGRARRLVHPDARPQRRPRRGDAARAADAVVPQHVVVGTRRPPARASSSKDGALVAEHPQPRPDGAARATATRRACSATTRRTPRGCGDVDGRARTRRTASATTSCTARRR